MSDLKGFVKSYKSSYIFLPIIPIDFNDIDIHNAAFIYEHNYNYITLLLRSNYLIFICEISKNQSLHGFVESYLYSRRKFEHLNSKDNQISELLNGLDRKISLFFLRSLSIDNYEYETLSKLLPNQKLTIASKSSLDATTNDITNIQTQLFLEEYRNIIKAIPFFKLPYLLDLFAINNDVNINITSKLMIGYQELRKSSYKKEIKDLFLESIQVISSLDNSIYNLYYKINNKITNKNSKNKNKTNFPSKDGILSKVKGISVIKHNTFIYDNENLTSLATYKNEFIFLIEYCMDISYTLYSFLKVLNHNDYIKLNNFILCLDGTHVTGGCGVSFINSLQNIYNQVLPISIKIISILKNEKNDNKNNTNPYLLNEIDIKKLENLLSIIQWSILEILHILTTITTTSWNYKITSAMNSNKNISSNNSNKYYDNMDFLREDGVTWQTVIIEQNQNNLLQHKIKQSNNTNLHIIEDESLIYNGLLFSDYMKVYNKHNLELLLLNYNDSIYIPIKDLLIDENESISYIIESLSLEDSLIIEQIQLKDNQITHNNPTKDNEKCELIPKKNNQYNDNLKNNISNIKSIFPELGDGFIEACLNVYLGNIEEIIDALLTNNLNPKLLSLDQKMHKIWIGKGGQNDLKSNISLNSKQRDDDNVYKAINDHKFKEIQKEYVRSIEKEQEYDHMLLTKDYYDDDYDDQYDELNSVDKLKASGEFSDIISYNIYNNTSRDLKSEEQIYFSQQAIELMNRREKRQNKHVINTSSFKAKEPVKTEVIHKQMYDMKRINNMTKSAEQEAAYWEGMRNTNKDHKSLSSKNNWKTNQNNNNDIDNQKDDTVIDINSINQKVSSIDSTMNKEKSKIIIDNTTKSNSNKEKDTDAIVEGVKKHRTKQFDKHHQKDKSIRKFSNFTPPV